jgi:hypothetical protein
VTGHQSQNPEDQGLLDFLAAQRAAALSIVAGLDELTRPGASRFLGIARSADRGVDCADAGPGAMMGYGGFRRPRGIRHLGR